MKKNIQKHAFIDNQTQININSIPLQKQIVIDLKTYKTQKLKFTKANFRLLTKISVMVVKIAF